MPQAQSVQSHAAMDPLYHYLLLPVFLINLIVAFVLTVRAWPQDQTGHIWSIVMATALFLFCAKLRSYALADQDRIIRLEERLRIAALSPAAEVSKLSSPQLIALRFASDAELPALVTRTLTDNLDPKAIKQSIVNWRPDLQRI